MLVDVEKSLSFKTNYDKKTGSYSGAIVGSGCLVKRGKGVLTMNDGNTYSGGTIVENGTLKAGGASSFGTGDISLLGGTLDLAGKAVVNDIELNGGAVIKGGAKYTGEFTMTGGVLQKGSVINVADTATLEAGAMDGTLSGTGMVQVTGAVTLSDAAKMNLNIKAEGQNEHHKIEGIFKALARALKMAVKRDIYHYELPSSKGVL
jgi:autotransporter-associated beta strand protein